MQLYPHQQKALDETADRQRVAYYLDMGLGKTVQICVFLQCLSNRGELHSCLVICPNSVMAVWESTLCNWSGRIMFRI